ncbi:helix-turn-helix domain-containing protein [Sanguibacter antarcticus]|uniref:Regulatory LuxR family protein n=1 Tax=Sanguibacter antarcticus TaxID=372484 RepID=A0A2A9E5A7_9MICO|nr:helix-turn-helix transcriptional regulator [Sanguibacter antarcticus]PFG33349.1 regulatory LuxR family protein [Sanguibacter antarcticus]
MSQHVSVVAPRAASLGAALTATLAAMGWSTERSYDLSGVVGACCQLLTVLVVEDDDGSVPETIGLLTTTPRVCIGSSRALPLYLALAERGSTVLNRDAPFAILIHLVDEALRENSPRPGSAPVDTTPLRDRIIEADALARLTPQELATLKSLMEGATASEIATRSFRSLNTVRSQIRAVLCKLSVSSQTAATALAERVGGVAPVHHGRARFTNIGDVR